MNGALSRNKGVGRLGLPTRGRLREVEIVLKEALVGSHRHSSFCLYCVVYREQEFAIVS